MTAPTVPPVPPRELRVGDVIAGQVMPLGDDATVLFVYPYSSHGVIAQRFIHVTYVDRFAPDSTSFLDRDAGLPVLSRGPVVFGEVDTSQGGECSDMGTGPLPAGGMAQLYGCCSAAATEAHTDDCPQKP